MIAEEMVGIDVDGANDSAQTELDDAPIIAGNAPPARLPAVHPFAVVGEFVGNENSTPGYEQMFFFREKFVVRD